MSILISIPALAQVKTDSTASNDFVDFKLPPDIFRDQEPRVDSILIYSYFYDEAKQQAVFFPMAGNPGSASQFLYDDTRFDKLFSDGFNQFDPYLVRPLKDFPMKNIERRFTNLNYHIASKKEQHIFLKHEQRIKPWFVAGLDFGALSSPGDFARTLKTNRNFDIYFGYEAPSKVYRNYVSFTSNRVVNQENGGISNDIEFETATSLNTRTLPINLPNSSIKHRSRDYFLKQELNLTRLVHKADSVDRLGKFKKGSLVLNHSIWWNRKYALFTSQDAKIGYFDNYYADSVVTYDSSFYNDVYQVAMLEYTTQHSASGRSFRLGTGFEYEQNNYKTGSSDTSFTTGAAVLSAGFEANRLRMGIFYSKSVTGDFEEGFRARLYLNYTFNKTRNDQVYLRLNAGKLAHSAKEILYVSNHFTWKNDFDLLQLYDLTAGVSWSKIRVYVEARNRTAKNLVFYREDYLPQTFGEYVSVSELSVSNTLRFGKVGFDNKITGTVSGNENVVPVAPLSLFSSLYYQNRFFKKVLGFKAGLDVSYYSEYYGYGYMPATGVFYVQDEKLIGNYPFAGIFVNLKIKSAATLFIRVDHVNAGLGERTYYNAYHYPSPGRTFKFGIWWDMVN